MRLLSVNVSMGREIAYLSKTVRTGIFKTPVAGRTMLRALNLDGDAQADLSAHGGLFKSAYAYPIENYGYWQQELGRSEFPYGQFGENFTVEGMREDRVHVGDVFQIGDAVVEVSQPRVPCYKLGIKMNLPDFLARFLASGRVGFYLRVLTEGSVGAGDIPKLVETDPEGITVKEITRLLYFDRDNLDGAVRALRISALSPGWRRSFQDRLSASERGS